MRFTIALSLLLAGLGMAAPAVDCTEDCRRSGVDKTDTVKRVSLVLYGENWPLCYPPLIISWSTARVYNGEALADNRNV